MMVSKVKNVMIMVLMFILFNAGYSAEGTDAVFISKSKVLYDHYSYPVIKRIVNRIKGIMSIHTDINILILADKDFYNAAVFNENSILIGEPLVEDLFPTSKSDSGYITFVIAHELSHIYCGHQSQRMRFKGVVGNNAVFFNIFSQELEIQADIEAIMSMIRMGYSIEKALFYAQETLNRLINKTSEIPPKYLLFFDHPALISRKKTLSELQWKIYDLSEKFWISTILLAKREQLEEVKEIYQALLKFLPDDINILNNLSIVYFLQAVELLEQIEPLKFRDFYFVAKLPSEFTHRKRGSMLVEEERIRREAFLLLDKAIDLCKDILRKNSQNVYAMVHMGVFNRIKGEYEQDLKKARVYLDSSYHFLKKALSLVKDPFTKVKILYNIEGVSYTSFIKGVNTLVNREKKFPPYWVKEIEENSKDFIQLEEPYYYLALYYEYKKDTKNAKRIWKKLLQIGGVYSLQAQSRIEAASEYVAEKIIRKLDENIKGIGLRSSESRLKEVFGEPLIEREIFVPGTGGSMTLLVYKFGEVYIYGGEIKQMIIYGNVEESKIIKTKYGITPGMRLSEVIKIYRGVGIKENVVLNSSNLMEYNISYPLINGGILMLTFGFKDENEEPVLEKITFTEL